MIRGTMAPAANDRDTGFSAHWACSFNSLLDASATIMIIIINNKHLLLVRRTPRENGFWCMSSFNPHHTPRAFQCFPLICGFTSAVWVTGGQPGSKHSMEDFKNEKKISEVSNWTSFWVVWRGTLYCAVRVTWAINLPVVWWTQCSVFRPLVSHWVAALVTRRSVAGSWC